MPDPNPELPLTGEIADLNWRTEPRSSESQWTVLSFRLEWPEDGRVKAANVRMRGHPIRGFVRRGDQVEVSGRWDDRTLDADWIRNRETAAIVVSDESDALDAGSLERPTPLHGWVLDDPEHRTSPNGTPNTVLAARIEARPDDGRAFTRDAELWAPRIKGHVSKNDEVKVFGEWRHNVLFADRIDVMADDGAVLGSVVPEGRPQTWVKVLNVALAVAAALIFLLVTVTIVWAIVNGGDPPPWIPW